MTCGNIPSFKLEGTSLLFSYSYDVNKNYALRITGTSAAARDKEVKTFNGSAAN